MVIGKRLLPPIFNFLKNNVGGNPLAIEKIRLPGGYQITAVTN
jgi:hypothetical protein